MKDQLSALIDGEFDVASAEHLITSVKLGGELKDCWQQYHLIGDAMRNEMVSRALNIRERTVPIGHCINVAISS